MMQMPSGPADHYYSLFRFADDADDATLQLPAYLPTLPFLSGPAFLPGQAFLFGSASLPADPVTCPGPA
ncbi:hypothetical protein ACOMHN_037218 [Nucella lapillus]